MLCQIKEVHFTNNFVVLLLLLLLLLQLLILLFLLLFLEMEMRLFCSKPILVPV